VVVCKRDPESAPPVRVASLDYVVPEKAPQPSNVLESLVWDREKDVDRLRERVPMARAMMLARASDAKLPHRDFLGAIRTAVNARRALQQDEWGSDGGGDGNMGGGGDGGKGGGKGEVPVAIVTFLRASLHLGPSAFMDMGSAAEADAGAIIP